MITPVNQILRQVVLTEVTANTRVARTAFAASRTVPARDSVFSPTANSSAAAFRESASLAHKSVSKISNLFRKMIQVRKRKTKEIPSDQQNRIHLHQALRKLCILNLSEQQCDQIGRFLQVLCNKLSCKIGSNNLVTFWAFSDYVTIMLQVCGYFWLQNRLK